MAGFKVSFSERFLCSNSYPNSQNLCFTHPYNHVWTWLQTFKKIFPLQEMDDLSSVQPVRDPGQSSTGGVASTEGSNSSLNGAPTQSSS